jgi:pimeloyl-ACP methyl ester carboxylesterase
MNARQAARAAAAMALCVVGFWLARTLPYHERTFLIDAGGCRMETRIVEPARGAAQGSVVLLHGLAANKRIMSYLTQGFAEQGLRVFVPDLPGHGRTAGPFTPQRVEACSEALLRELFARGLVQPQRTILAGHSMGGAIAVRVASRVSVAGAIAISPAPMRSAHGVWPEMLLFTDPAPLPPNSLVLSGSLEPESMRGSAADLLTSRNDGSAKYAVIPGATHVSLLFMPSTVRASQAWAARVLHLEGSAALPSQRWLAGSLLGVIGLLLLAGPFLREMLQGQPNGETSRDVLRKAGGTTARPAARLLLEFMVIAMLTVLLLRMGMPLHSLHLFEGDYLASFIFIVGAALFLLHRNALRGIFRARLGAIFAAGFAAMVIHLLITSWFDLTLSEAWFTAARWLRFPALFAAVLPYHLAEELLLGPVAARRGGRRLALGLSLRFVAWLALLAGIFYLHSGEILLALLAPYFALFSVFQRWSMDIIQEKTESPEAAAMFGAILLAGFCLVLFPLS